MNRRADWVAWGFQFVLGLLFGGLASAVLIVRATGWDSMTAPGLLLRAVGGGLLGAALASYYGDRVWLGSAYKVIPPDSPE